MAGDAAAARQAAGAGPAEGSVGDALRTLGRAVRREGAHRVQQGRAAVARAAEVDLAGKGADLLRRASTRLGRRPSEAVQRPAPAGRPEGPSSPVAALRWGRVRAAGARGVRAVLGRWPLAVWSLLLVGGAALATVLAVWITMRDLPLAETLPPLPEPTIAVELASGEPLTSRGAYRAPYVALDEMPPHLAGAVVAIEDRRFRDHPGVDLRAAARALLRNTQAGAVVQGGSTITQQLVKILYLTPERSLSRKLQEAVLAGMLERQLGKDRVLELYLNSVYLGAGAYGMPAAARTYFDKDVGALSLPEAALLAASIQLPSQVNPFGDLQAARSRATLVLAAMADQGRIDAPALEQAMAGLARLAPQPLPSRAGSYFADWVLADLEALKGLAAGGMVATATLDPVLQARAEAIVRDVMAARGAAAGASQVALVAMTPDGRVRALVGGLDYASSQFNRATDARRQPGSTFKLFVYMAALAMWAAPDTPVSDAPVAIGDWRPENFDRRSHGTVTLMEAFAQSYNLAAVRLAQEVGIENVIDVARRFGIEAELKPTPSLALGTSEVTLLDMTEAFAGLARGRIPVRATGIEALRLTDSADTLSVAQAGAGEQTSLSRTHQPMLALLRAVVEQGTGRAAAVEGFDVLGKTGTSQDSRDAWFIGLVEGQPLVVGVWVGNDDNSPMDRVTGGGLPAEIFRRTVSAALETPGRGVPEAQAAAAAPAAPAQCDLRACSAAYRSFRASDCSFQPYSGPRRLCTR